MYHFSRYIYRNLHNNDSSEETLEGKHAFERMVASNDIIIKQYHSDNEILRANDWVQDCQERTNTKLTTYTRVDAHHINGLSERIIGDIQDNGRSMMIHYQQKCTESITDKLWPYNLRHAKNDYNTTPLLAHPQGLSPLQLFTVTQVKEKPRHFNPFGFPTYVLNEALRYYQKIHHKWKTRSKYGV